MASRLTPLLSVTALLEAATGVLLLTVPALVLTALFGWDQPLPEPLVVSRVAGAAILSIAIASWAARGGDQSPAQRGVLIALLAYNVVVAAVFAYTGTALRTAGWLLWPAVRCHSALGAWCIVCARGAGKPERR